jgi:hypothetical protein
VSVAGNNHGGGVMIDCEYKNGGNELREVVTVICLTVRGGVVRGGACRFFNAIVFTAKRKEVPAIVGILKQRDLSVLVAGFQLDVVA